MPSIQVNSPHIQIFQFSAAFDLYNKQLIFKDQSTYSSAGSTAISKMSFGLEDSDGIVIKSIDLNNPDINPSLGQTTFTLDLEAFGLPFILGNTFKITGAVVDGANTYYTTAVLKTVCKPVGITESGYVPGLFQVTADCPSNILTVKELTAFVYSGNTPVSVTKAGTFYYPTGTIAPVVFTGTPFTNNEIFTGENRVSCTTVATYDLGDQVFVLVTYLTDQAFKVTCGHKIMDLMCCLSDLEQTAIKNCDNAKGLAARQKMADVQFYLFVGLGKEINGEDASFEANYIRKTLNCDCGALTLGQNEESPINPAVTSIVLQGAGGTTIPAATINGNTKTFIISSNIYQVVKGVPGDLAFSITTDTSTPGVVKYKITFNYDALASNILTAIQNDPALLGILNSMITASGFSLTGLDGKCIIDTSKCNYVLQWAVSSGGQLVASVIINGVTHTAPGGLVVSDDAGIQTWLNSLGLGSFVAQYLKPYLVITSTANTNKVQTMNFTGDTGTGNFSAVCPQLRDVLQAIINYLCALTTCQVALCKALNVEFFDYNGNIISESLTTSNTQDDANTLFQNAINNIVNRINTLTGVTCDKLKAIFQDRPLSVLQGNARVYGLDAAGNCTAWSPEQLGLGVMQSAQNFQDVKDAFCAIDCTTPATCPNISAINMAIIGGNIGIYGVTFTPVANASQTLTVRYRVTGNLSWITATNNLLVFANGNVQSNPPYTISGLTQGTTYDVQVVNNCGGTGFISQITTPTGSVFSGNFLLSNSLYTICGVGQITLYSSSPFATGVTMYSNVGLTIPVTGFSYIASAATGDIYQLNPATGVVGTNTGSSCINGVAGTYRLGNSSATICSVSPVTRYTNGAFATGGVLYMDAALTTPVTGSSFVVNGADNHIYNLNSVTGVIGSDTGLTCTINYFLEAAFNFSIDSVTGVGIPTLPPTGVNGSQSGFHTNMSGAYAVTLSGSVVTTTKLVALVNGVQVSCIAVVGPATYGLNITASPSDEVRITVNSGTC